MARAFKNQIIIDAVRRFQHLPTRTIARHVLNTHGELWENDLEKVRDSVRYYRGQHGDFNREQASTKDFFCDSISMPQTWRKIRTPHKLHEGTWLVLSDIHIPFHEPKIVETAIDAGMVEKVNGVLLNGDVQDCSSISYWRSLKRDFNKEIELSIDFLDYLRIKFPKCTIVYKPGNHELRLPSYYMNHAPELADTPLACMETILGFEERGIEFLDYYQKVMAGKLPIFHGHEFRNITMAVNAARGLFLKTHSFAAISHCHTTSMHPGTNVNREALTTWSFGCLCDLSPDYNPFGNQWNWGFAIIEIEKNGDFFVNNRRILPSGDVV